MEKNRLQTALERERREGGVIDLIDTNFHRNGFIFPEEPLRALVDEYLGSRMYDPDPRGDPAAREAIRDFYEGNGIGLSAERILITASASESYDLLFTSLASPGDSILLPSPGYPLFEFLARKAGLETVFYSLSEADGYRIDLGSVKAGATLHTKFLVLISPNNPTGRIAEEEEIRGMLSICRRYGIMLIVDEVFSEFTYTGRPLPRPAKFAEDVPVFTLNGISKMFACPDLKLSWIAASGPPRRMAELVETLEVRNDVFLSCSSLTQRILPGLFRYGGEFVRRMVKEADGRRRLLVRGLERGAGGRGEPGDSPLTFTEPDGGIHCIVRIGNEVGPGGGPRFPDDESFALELLARKKVYVHPGYFYGIENGVCLVLSFLTRQEVLEEGLARLLEFCSTPAP